MKKILLIISVLLLAALPVAFAACSSISQQALLQIGYVCSENGEELYTYDVYHREGENKESLVKVGSMTMSYRLVKNKAVSLSDIESETGLRTFENVFGGRLTINVTLNNGDSVFSDVVYKSSQVAPIYSYKKTVIGGEEKIMQVVYGNGKYLHARRYEKTSADAETFQKVSDYRYKKDGCYDNEQIYALVRASQIESTSSFSISYSCVSPLAATVDTITISKGSAVAPLEEALALPEDAKCYAVKISTGNSYASSYLLSIVNANTPEIRSTIKNAKKVIHTIVEDDYVYALKSIDIN